MGLTNFSSVLHPFIAVVALGLLGAGDTWSRLDLPPDPKVPGQEARAPETKAAPPKDSISPAKNPEQPSKPRREEKDCDDCVIVKIEIAPDVPRDGGDQGGAETMPTALAGTLWGLFMVSRPRRTPRTIIRGVTVP